MTTEQPHARNGSDQNALTASVRFLELVLVKVRLNLRSEASRTWLAYTWWILDPLFHMAIFYVVFKVLLNRGGPDYLIFLLTGLIPWLWFSKSVSNAAGSIVASQQLVQSQRINKAFYPLVVVGQDAAKQSAALLLLLGAVMAGGHNPTLAWAWLPILVAVQLAVVAATALVLAAVVPFAPDLRHLIPTGLLFLMLVSGVFYDFTDLVAPEHQRLFLINPIAALIGSYRQVLLHGEPPHLIHLSALAVMTALLLVASIKAYQRAGSALVKAVVR